MQFPDKTNPEKRKIVPVIPAGVAKKAARPAGRKFLDYIFSESPRDMMEKVIGDVLVPRAKAAFQESAMAFLDGMLWNGGRSPTSGSIMRGTVIRGGSTVYNGMDYNSMSNPNVIAAQAAGNLSGPYQDLVVGSQQAAESLLASLIDNINQYRVVTVADLYEAAAITPDAHHGNFGWYGLDGARITKEREGYRLMLPKPVRV